ncbi:hypothetical protein CKM354_001225400 [Cercospora kikuchii]|uniref:Diphthine--ammonia ligase n=1 Tax=Cercospora kikuchii TaxID=84275 RepID=A0A9P3FLN0_9PEZI|nr:diphthine--ammonia ligase [Cercospora kikuchii]GIZ49219.1 hypothetical protein CKM354_001225400 [Cercospora kikuchii]
MSLLNVIALISGGKDSFFSILHCQANGHKVVALANLHPKSQDDEDLDSFMYQTIGHAIIPLYEQALGLPLYRQEICGTAAVQDRDYHHSSAEDETESLLPLLRKVLAAHPEVNAVSTGAIMSDYQRTRVESVALRLGLTPLSYLWQWPTLPPQTQTSLLEDMAAVGQDSRIIKVASGGLDESFLWQNVADTRTRLRLSKAAARFGTPGDGAVLGEGGEFETLAISGPAPLWKGRIVVAPENIRNVPGEAGSATVRLTEAAVVLHDDQASEPPTSTSVRIPTLLEARFESILQAVRNKSSFEVDAGALVFCQTSASGATHNDGPDDDIEVLADITGEGTTAAAQTQAIMDQVVATLARKGFTIADIANVTIVLRNMDDFTSVNPVYGSYFSKPNPPARVTVACGDVLRENALLAISVVVESGKRDGLHVQSRSYWAPANIGPYSQSIKLSAPGRQKTYVAGQIPLIPASMQLPDHSSEGESHDFTLQSVLALQHLDRIGRIMKVGQWAYCIAFIASDGVEQAVLTRRADMARNIWKEYHTPQSLPTSGGEPEDDDDFDVWDHQHGSRRGEWQTNSSSSRHEKNTRDGSSKCVPPLAVIAASALPRGADIEWVGFGDSTTMTESVTPVHFASVLKAFNHRILPLVSASDPLTIS